VIWPILNAARAALDLDWRPSGDWALLTMRVEDVGRDTPIVGPGMIRDPWNPFLTLLPLALTVFLVWSVIEGDFWMWPPLTFLVSFELKSHIGYLPMLAMLGISVVAITWRRKSFDTLLPTSTKQRFWVLGISFAVLIGCWIPVLLDQIVGTGNLGAIAHYFFSNGDSPAGFGTALHVAADQLRFPSAPWLGRSELAGLDGALLGSRFTALIVPILSMAGSLWLAVRMRVLAAFRFQLVVIATALGGLIATARVTGPLFDWVVRWWWVIACLWWLSIV
jgi:hypothetical protein